MWTEDQWPNTNWRSAALQESSRPSAPDGLLNSSVQMAIVGLPNLYHIRQSNRSIYRSTLYNYNLCINIYLFIFGYINPYIFILAVCSSGRPWWILIVVLSAPSTYGLMKCAPWSGDCFNAGSTLNKHHSELSVTTSQLLSGTTLKTVVRGNVHSGQSFLYGFA